MGDGALCYGALEIVSLLFIIIIINMQYNNIPNTVKHWMNELPKITAIRTFPSLQFTQIWFQT